MSIGGRARSALRNPRKIQKSAGAAGAALADLVVTAHQSQDRRGGHAAVGGVGRVGRPTVSPGSGLRKVVSGRRRPSSEASIIVIEP